MGNSESDSWIPPVIAHVHSDIPHIQMRLLLGYFGNIATVVKKPPETMCQHKFLYIKEDDYIAPSHN